jgi:hypothetical protein
MKLTFSSSKYSFQSLTSSVHDQGYFSRIVWRYQRGNQNPYIEEEQTTQWPKEKVQKDKQRSTKHTYKTKDRVTRTPLTTGGELRCSGRVAVPETRRRERWILFLIVSQHIKDFDGFFLYFFTININIETSCILLWLTISIYCYFK